ncbi:CHAT domain-containing protein [Chamaesiphon minutus]|uniref:FHA domain-containing protein n=1 Tax=Chamaesiphon minutus (strain ATCC 27169 / PCC 6605) TaxID=1173020 RepID=K9UHQ7_CHAP6|nr:CHAT domain-containing protein [Chamaesiphon minutus]AFY94325.1 FHA domain-containing protein [Chamaesiphon minutus PCC 6605]
MDEHPSLNIAVARLGATTPDNYAVWVLKAPYPGGYVIENCTWTIELSQIWLGWQGLFNPGSRPYCLPCHQDLSIPELDLETIAPVDAPQPQLYSANLMQHLGINLWQWLFCKQVGNAFAQSQGMAIGQGKSLRLRLEIRDPDSISIPWEIMQSQHGKPALSIDRLVLFSRTNSDVDPLPPQRLDRSIKILLVLGQNIPGSPNLDLEKESATIAQALRSTMPSGFNPPNRLNPAGCNVDTLVRPTPEELIAKLESQQYNVFFYAGHGMSAPDGGLLLLNDVGGLNGTELAQLLVRCGVKLAVFNSCWGAQPYQHQQQAVPRSSLAEVLLHYGVPAVLAMRDTIADREALSFIQTFTQALAHRLSIDEAAAIARQQLLISFKFNQPAWTLPILYMHPEFNGELIRPLAEAITEIPSVPQAIPVAYMRSLSFHTHPDFPIDGGLMRVGRSNDNDLVVVEPWVSQRHAEIIYRSPSMTDFTQGIYYLRDTSRFGSYVLTLENKWVKVHAREFPLESGMQIKFGSEEGQILEFRIDRQEWLR